MSVSKLSKDSKQIVLRMHAENHGVPDIVKYLDENKLSRPAVSSIRAFLRNDCHKAEIDKYRRVYYSKINEVPIANKRARLDVIQKVVDTLKITMSKMIKPDGSVKNKEFNKVMTLVKRVDEMLSSAHNEMERKPGLTLELTQNFGDVALTDEELIVEERRVLGKIEELKRAGVSFPDRGVLQLTESQVS